MKKILFWVTFPIAFPLLVIFGLSSWAMYELARLAEAAAMWIEAWRAFCFFDPKAEEKEREEVRARLIREIHKNGREE